ncbi:ATP synthase F1 subunit gamma [Thermostilla marina]
MAKARALDRRRKSVRNIRKITRTMELISTARFKRAMDRAVAATAYTNRIAALVGHLTEAGLQVSHPLLEPRTTTRRAVLLVLTSNRGLCGGYNSGVLRTAIAAHRNLREEYDQVALEVSGKRGISAFRFRGTEVAEAYTHFEDRPKFVDVDVLAKRYLDEYTCGDLDRVDVAYVRFESASRQYPVVETLLPPAALEEGEEAASRAQYDFFPSAESILEEVVPMSIKIRLFKFFLDAAVSEQIARMVAMKTATDNADQMISHLSMAYNRARQTQITSELLEVISGAEAIQ